MNKYMEIIVPFLIGLTTLVLFLSLWGFYFAIRPIKIVSTLTPKDFGIPYQTISFQTKDGITIHGWFVPAKKQNAKTLILLHGYPADKGNILPSRIFLHADYNLLFFDFRYLGESGGKYSTIGKNEVLDLLAAIDYLEKKGINEVGVWGLSLGGSVALMTATQAPQIKALVIESAYARLDWMANEYFRIPILNYPLAQLTRFWGWLFLGYDIKDIAPAKSAEKLTLPILLIYSTYDTVVSFQHGLLLQKSLQHNPNAKFIFVDEIRHGQPIKEYQALVKQFFDKYL